MKDKALDLLRIAALPIGSAERWALVQAVAAKWSWRAYEKKAHELIDRGYIEPLRNDTAFGGLTDKGKAALLAARPPETETK